VLPVADFGAVLAVLALPFAATFPALALQAAAAAAARAGSRILIAANGWTLKLAGGACALAIALAFARPLAEALKLPSVWLLAMAPLAAAAIVVHLAVAGAVLGAGATAGATAERRYAGLVLVEPALRLAIAWPLLAALRDATFAAAAPVLAVAVAPSACALFAWWRWLRPDATGSATMSTAPRGIAGSAVLRTRRALLGLSAYGLLVAMDIPAVRVLLDAEEAGRFAGVAAASRFLVLVPIPLSLLLVARMHLALLRGQQPVRELFQTLGFLLAAAVLGLAVVHLASGRLLAILLGADFDGLGPAYERYAFAMALYGVAQGLLLFGIVLRTSGMTALPLATLAATALLLAERGTALPECIGVVRLLSVVFAVLLAIVALLPLLALRKRR
jgi:hypothetical protein